MYMRHQSQRHEIKLINKQLEQRAVFVAMPRNRFFDNQKIIIQRGKCECDWLLTCCECIIHPPIIISVHAHSWQPVVISCRANLSLVSLLSPANQSTNQDQFSLALQQIHH